MSELIVPIQISLTLALALILDRFLGEPSRWHPLVGFGHCANWLEARLNNRGRSSRSQRLLGVLAWITLIAPWVALALWLNRLDLVIVDALIVYWALGLNSLNQHALRVYRHLKDNDLANGQKYSGYMVSRDTSKLNEQECSRATVESVLENGHDGVVAPLVWFVLGGAPAVVLFRLANTLDAMWGYKNSRFNYFGWWSARADDVLGWIPARICAILYALAGKTSQALDCWLQQAKAYKSPNAGPVMASGAGALNISIGGGAVYHGEFVAAPKLGKGRAVEETDITTSLDLVSRASWLWVALVFFVELGLVLL